MSHIIIFRYTPTCDGIGDFLRAAGSLYNYCTINNHYFFLDITNPIGTFFTYTRYNGTILGFAKHVLRNVSSDKIINVLRDVSCNTIIQANHPLDWEKLDQHVFSLRTILNPTAQILNMHKQLLETKSLKPNLYTCIHIRFGDNVLRNTTQDNRIGRSSKSIDERIILCLAAIKNKDNPIVLLTDNYSAKLTLAKKYNFIYFDITPVHTSFTKDSSAIEKTVLEFLTIAEAAEVVAVARSGFSIWAAAYGGKPYTCVQ